MLRLKIFLFIVLSALIVSESALAQTIEETPQDLAELELDLFDTGNVMVIVPAERLAKVRNILDFLLENARTDAANGDIEEAAEELQLASNYIYVDAGQGNTLWQKQVIKAADEMEQIATYLAEGSKTPLHEIDTVIFNAHRSLARYHRHRAEMLLEAKFTSASGKALEAALIHYEHAALSNALMNNTKVDTNLYSTVDDMEKVAKMLIQEDNIPPSHAQKTITHLRQAIDALGS